MASAERLGIDPEMPLTLLVNPSSGGGRTLKLLPRVEQALDQRRVEFRVQRTKSLDHGVDQALGAIEAGELPVVISGDGLIGAVGGAMAGSETPLGIVPGGRGNDLARVLGIPEDPEAAANLLLDGERRRIDVGEVNGKRFLGIVSVGFDSEANRVANETHFLRGNLVYAYAAIRTLVSWKPGRFTVRVDDSRERFTGYSVSVANNRAFGGGMFIAPEAELDDGEFDVVIVGEVGKLRFVGNLPKVFKGTHIEEEQVRVFRARHLELSASRSLPRLRRRRAPHRPAGVAARAAAVAQRHRPAPVGGLSDRRPSGGLFAAKRAVARSIGAASRVSGRGGGTTLPGRVLLRLAPDAIGRLGAGLEDGDPGQRHQREDDDGGDDRLDARRRRPPAGPQPSRLEHDLGRRHGAARAARQRGPVRGRRGLAAAGGRGARPVADRPRQPLPRPARPLRGDRGTRR